MAKILDMSYLQPNLKMKNPDSVMETKQSRVSLHACLMDPSTHSMDGLLPRNIPKRAQAKEEEELSTTALEIEKVT